MLLILVEVSVKVACRQQVHYDLYLMHLNKVNACTYFTKKSAILLHLMYIMIALWPQSVAVMDLQATFTDTSTTISCMVMALWLQSVTVVD